MGAIGKALLSQMPTMVMKCANIWKELWWFSSWWAKTPKITRLLYDSLFVHNWIFILCVFILNELIAFVHSMSQPLPWARDQGKGLQRCGPRGKLKNHILCFRECKRVWGNEHPHSQVSSHFGSRSSDGLLNFQITITRSKPIGSKSFVYHYKSSWNLDV